MIGVQAAGVIAAGGRRPAALEQKASYRADFIGAKREFGWV
jgi:hypothetical protein